MTFHQKLIRLVHQNHSLLCVGLDPNPHRYPNHFVGVDDDPQAVLTAWGERIIAQTQTLVCCYKPNIAFYEQYGAAGWEALRATIAAIPDHIPVLLDAKRGDIGSTAEAYARAAFEELGADAITVSPYLGQDSIAPFLAYPGKAVFVLCYTSNPSASAVQSFGMGKTHLFEHVAQEASEWGDGTQVGFVVGATQLEALTRFRAITKNDLRWVLAPGIGAQGGQLGEALSAGLLPDGTGVIVPVSRAILYADDPHQAALTLRDQINTARAARRALPPWAEHQRAQVIVKLHDIGCVQFGEFTLASGKSSPIYIDLRRITSDAALLNTVAQMYADLLKSLTYDHVAAVPYAALTIGTAVALAARASLIYPRKEVKTYGTGRTIEGVFTEGDTVVIIEDLVTTGGSVLKATETLNAVGLQIQDVIVLIDREQGGRANLAQAGYQLQAVFTISEILDTLESLSRITPQQAQTVRMYLQGRK